MPRLQKYLKFCGMPEFNHHERSEDNIKLMQPKTLKVTEVDYIKVDDKKMPVQIRAMSTQPYIPGFCHGDSGGPLMKFDITSGKFEVVGIVSGLKLPKKPQGPRGCLGPSPGVYVNLDLQVTLLNRENFIENLQFSVSNAQYSMPQDIHQNRKIGDTRNVLENGNRSFLSIADLLSYRPRFVDTNGEFQIELRVSNIKTAFINSFTIQKVFTSKGSHDAENDVSLDYDKMEIKSEISGLCN